MVVTPLFFIIFIIMRISQRKHYHLAFTISTNNPFFKDKEEVVISQDQFGLCFSVPSIDDDNGVKIYKSGKSGYQMSLYSVELREGILTHDKEESNEDFIFFNY